MTSASERQWQRVDCRLPVQVEVSVDGSEARRTLCAQAINLSEGGVQLRATGELPVGESVTCSLMLEGQPTDLPGYVRWNRATLPGMSQAGIGIQFDSEQLSDDTSSLLRAVISRVHRAGCGDQPVELYFADLKDPVHARAFTSDAGLHIRAALPVLARDSAVEFQFGGKGPRFLSRVSRVFVREHERTPHIEVELALEAREMPRFRRYTMYGDPDATSLDAKSLGAIGDRAKDEATMQEHARPRNATLRLWDESSASTESASAEAPRELRGERAKGSPRDDKDTEETLLPLPKAPWIESTQKLLWPVALIALGAVMGAWIAPAYDLLRANASVVAKDDELPAPRARAARPKSQTMPSAHSVKSTSTGNALGAASNATAAAHDQAPVSPSEPQPSPSSELPHASHAAAPQLARVHVAVDATELSLPFSGSRDDLRTMLWASPIALVVDAALGGAELGVLAEPLRGGPVARVSLVPIGHAQQLRIFLTHKPARYALDVSGGQLRVRIEPGAPTDDIKEPRALR